MQIEKPSKSNVEVLAWGKENTGLDCCLSTHSKVIMRS